MPEVVEESETEYPSFSQNKKIKRQDSEFDKVIDSVLNENRDRSKSPFRRDDLSDDDDDDDDIQPSAAGGNILQDYTFAGGAVGMMPPKKKTPKKLDSISAIRDYLETELG